MASASVPRPSEAIRRPARDLIEAVLDNMRRNLEPLKYSTLAPSRYLVYIHPGEYARLEGILPILREQTARALAEELAALNRRSAVRRYTARLFGGASPTVQTAADWHIEFLPDPDDVVGEGDILVDSELLIPESPELGVGERTRRLSTMRSENHTTTRERTVERLPEPEKRSALARITYADRSGPHSVDITKDSVTLGRGGVTYPVDIKIVSSEDISREHARIRRDPASDRFFLIDLSSLGTTLNGRHVPAGFDTIEGSKRENGTETPLPDRARIGLAETVFLDFSVVGVRGTAEPR
jgi:FHA domain-containing protein